MLFLVGEYNWPTVLDTNVKSVVVRVQMWLQMCVLTL